MQEAPDPKQATGACADAGCTWSLPGLRDAPGNRLHTNMNAVEASGDPSFR